MRQFNVQRFEIGANAFGIRPMNPFDALAILGDLQKVVLPVVGNLAAGLDDIAVKDGSEEKKVVSMDSLSSLMEKNIDISKLGTALSKASASLDGDTIAKLSKKLLNENLISVEFEDGRQSKLNADTITELFSGNLAEMMQLIAKVIEVNYGDFFTFLAKLSGRVNGARQQKSPG